MELSLEEENNIFAPSDDLLLKQFSLLKSAVLVFFFFFLVVAHFADVFEHVVGLCEEIGGFVQVCCWIIIVLM